MQRKDWQCQTCQNRVGPVRCQRREIVLGFPLIRSTSGSIPGHSNVNLKDVNCPVLPHTKQFLHLFSSCSLLLASSTSFWCCRWCRSSSSELLAGKPGGLEINVIWTTFDLVSLLPPGLHDQTGAGHGLRLGSNQRISPLLPHDLCHLLRRPGEPSVRVDRCVKQGGITWIWGAGPGRESRTTLSWCSASYFQSYHWRKIAIIRKFMKDTQLRCILYVVTINNVKSAMSCNLFRFCWVWMTSKRLHCGDVSVVAFETFVCVAFFVLCYSIWCLSMMLCNLLFSIQSSCEKYASTWKIYFQSFFFSQCRWP